MATKEQSPIPRQEYSAWKEHSTGTSSVSIFLSDQEGRLLMVQDLDKYGGKWSPIAGYIDDLDHEEPEAAAIREASEELGLNVRSMSFGGGITTRWNTTNPFLEKQPMHSLRIHRVIIDGSLKNKDEIQNDFLQNSDSLSMIDKNLNTMR